MRPSHRESKGSRNSHPLGCRREPWGALGPTKPPIPRFGEVISDNGLLCQSVCQNTDGPGLGFRQSWTMAPDRERVRFSPRITECLINWLAYGKFAFSLRTNPERSGLDKAKTHRPKCSRIFLITSSRSRKLMMRIRPRILRISYF